MQSPGSQESNQGASRNSEAPGGAQRLSGASFEKEQPAELNCRAFSDLYLTTVDPELINKNPLLKITGPIPFDKILPEHIEPAIRELLRRSYQELDQIIEAPGPRTYENTILALDNLAKDLYGAWRIVLHLKGVCNSPELSRAHASVLPEVTEFHSRVSMSSELWRAVSDFAVSAEAAGLNGNSKRLLDSTISDFKRSGADLQPSEKQRLAEIDKELARLSTQFSDNVTAARAKFEYLTGDLSELEGLPQSILDLARHDAERRGHKNSWRLSLDAPCVAAVLSYAKNENVRRLFHVAQSSLASTAEHDNTATALRILELRQEKSALLGYDHFAEFQLERRMAGDAKRARAFLAEIQIAAQSGFEKERIELLEMKREHVANEFAELEPWDIAFYAEKLRQKQYNFEVEQLRPYFQFDAVLSGVFQVAQDLYGLRIRRRADLPVWHPEVQCFEVIEKDGKPLGIFYVDFFPREEKRGGAWQATLAAHEQEPGNYVGVIAGNFTRPLGESQALLTHSEVQTVFHEFGHLMHMLLTDVPERGLRTVPWDFIELPSQIMENWAWDRQVLDSFARHHESKLPIPEELFDRALAARNFRKASFLYRQLSFGTMDLALHSEYEPARDGPIGDYTRGILQPFCQFKLEKDDNFACHFSHIFAMGYAAGYYSYLWADALQADIFENVFRKQGLSNSATCESFRRGILARGDSEDALVYYNRFLGRDDTELPGAIALLRAAGIAP